MPSISQEFNRVLNVFCNSADGTCCVTGSGVSYLVHMATPVIIAILALYLGFYLVFASGATFALTPYLEARAFNLDGFFAVLHSIGSIAVLLLYMQMADRLDYFTRVSKVEQQVLCGCILLGAIVLSFLTLRYTGKEFLSSDQCYEWRGLMVIILILVDYSGLAKEFLGSSIINSVTAGFLFLSGYCHFCNFWSEGNISWKKSVQVLVRLNLFPLCVCASLGSSYSLYFLLPLLSLSFLLVFIFMISWPMSQSSSGRLIGTKFLVLYVVLLLFPLFKRVFSDQLEHSTGLYHMVEEQRFNPFWGMLVAYLVLVVKSNYLSFIYRHQYHLRLSAVISGIVMTLVYCTVVLRFQALSSRVEIRILPILSYMLLRSGIYALRNYTSFFLKEVGNMSMWLFVSHYHILLAYDGRGMLVLLPKLFIANAVVVVVVFVLIFVVINSSLRMLNQVKSLFL